MACRSQRLHDVVEAEPEIRNQNDWPAPEPIRQRALYRREHKLHQRLRGAEQPVDPRALGGIAADEIDHELGQHWNDDADRQHVEQHGDEHEGERSAARGAGGVFDTSRLLIRLQVCLSPVRRFQHFKATCGGRIGILEFPENRENNRCGLHSLFPHEQGIG